MMRYQLYKPNQKNTGCAATFNMGRNKDGSPCLFISAVLQASWNSQTMTGSFKENVKNPQKSTNVKMNQNEAGEMLSSLKTRNPVVFFHKLADTNTIITFSPWDRDRKVKVNGNENIHKSPAFGLTISKNSNLKFSLPIEAGETEVLALLLQDFINQCLFYEGSKFQNNGDVAPSSGSSELLGGETKPHEKEIIEEDDSEEIPF